jgi:phosphatidylserine/phosphatidylglycerophosphate/cardiolipin synthase-like enzyme
MIGDWMPEDKVRIVASGQKWLKGSEAIPIEVALCSLILEATEKIEITMYSIWTGFEFADRVWDEISAATDRGVQIYFVIDKFHSQRSEAAKRLVLDMLRKSPNTIGVRSFEDHNGIMHAKMVIADGSRAIISSSNQSDGGFAKNHEIGLLVEGPAASKASSMFGRLYNSNFCRPVNLL